MIDSESRIAPSPGAASDDSASPVNLQPGAAADRFAFEPVPLRYREDGLTPAKQRAYVEALADTGVAREAAARVGLSEQAINRVRRRSDARAFDNACEAAHLLGARRIRSVAWERAIEGTLKAHYYHGERVGEERVYDNRLLTYLYGKVAHLLEPSRESRLICSRWEDHMEALEQGLEPPDLSRPAPAARPDFTGYEVREDDEGLWWTSFPPPAGFDGVEDGEFGEEGYRRTLSDLEQAVLDAEYGRDEAEYRAAEAARRDRFFGFAGDEVSASGEAETHETSEPCGDEDLGPIEYKSLFPPTPETELSSVPGTTYLGAWHGPSPEATAQGHSRPASAETLRKRRHLRASARPREPVLRGSGTNRPRHPGRDIQIPPRRHPWG